MVGLLLIAGLGALLVVGLAELRRLYRRLARLSTGQRLAVSNTVIVCVWLALSPLYIARERAAGSPYGDEFVPYLLVRAVDVWRNSPGGRRACRTIVAVADNADR